MVKAIVTGAGGRMGGRIISLISMMDEIKVVAAVEVAGILLSVVTLAKA